MDKHQFLGGFHIDEDYFDTELSKKMQQRLGESYFINIIDNEFTFPVYTYELGTILLNKSFPLIGGGTFDGTAFQQVYVDAFRKGREYFIKEFSIDAKTLYNNAELYVQNLHECYYHKEPTKRKNGWIKYETSCPILIHNKAITEYGFFAGILFELKELQNKHPIVFKDFKFKCTHTLQQTETKTEQETPKTFEELFYNPKHAEPCLKILSELQPPVIDAINNYIGRAKGVFPLWIKVLKNHKPEPLIKHFKDTVYKNLLNQKVKGLNLTKDASEFRKQYVRLENDKIELDIKTILSQYSQSGKLGK